MDCMREPEFVQKNETELSGFRISLVNGGVRLDRTPGSRGSIPTLFLLFGAESHLILDHLLYGQDREGNV